MYVVSLFFCLYMVIVLLNIVDSGLLCSSLVWVLLVSIWLLCSSIMCLILGMIFLMWWVISIKVMFCCVSICIVVISCLWVIRFSLVEGLFSSSVCGWLISVWVISMWWVLLVDNLV